MNDIQNLLNQVAVISKKNDEILDASGGRFNMFRVCGVNHYENTHSAIIAEFLRPDGSHGLKETLLDCFVKMFCNDVLKQVFDCKNARVVTERSVGVDGRIDILIEDRNGHAIIIENKIYAGDQEKQLIRYGDFAEREYGKGNSQIFYLNLWGHKASEQSGQGVAYDCLSYQKDIIRWMEKCAGIAVNISTVRETVNQYINHLKSLTNQDMDTVNREEIIKLLCKPENIESAFVVGTNFADFKNHLINNVLIGQFTSVCSELGLEGEREQWEGVNAGFIVTMPSRKDFAIEFGFDCVNLINSIIGINYYPQENEGKNNGTFEMLKQHFPSVEGNTVWKSFPTYTSLSKDAMIAISNGEMAKIFKEEIERILNLTKDWI